jgi:flavin reductase
MVEATNFREAMAQLTSAVNIVTTTGVSGRFGFTASAVCSVTDSPPTLLVCMNKASYLHAHFVENKILNVNVLGAQHHFISNIFSSKMKSEERFKHGIWTTLKTGAPALKGALVSFDCNIEAIQEIGTHDIFICRVVDILQSQPSQPSQGLIYFRRTYYASGQPLSPTTL